MTWFGESWTSAQEPVNHCNANDAYPRVVAKQIGPSFAVDRKERDNIDLHVRMLSVKRLSGTMTWSGYEVCWDRGVWFGTSDCPGPCVFRPLALPFACTYIPCQGSAIEKREDRRASTNIRHVQKYRVHMHTGRYVHTWAVYLVPTLPELRIAPSDCRLLASQAIRNDKSRATRAPHRLAQRRWHLPCERDCSFLHNARAHLHGC